MNTQKRTNVRPFDAFMGKWSGVSRTFDTDENFLEAAQLTPDTYLYRVVSGASHTTLHNTHYFLTANERRVVTHKLKDGDTFVFQVQDFVRASD